MSLSQAIALMKAMTPEQLAEIIEEVEKAEAKAMGMEEQQRKRMKEVCKDIRGDRFTEYIAKLLPQLLGKMTRAEKFFYSNYGKTKKDYNTLVKCCEAELCLSKRVKDEFYDKLGKKKIMDYWMTMMNVHYLYSTIYQQIQEGNVLGDDGTHLKICNDVQKIYKILGAPNDLSEIITSLMVGICWKDGKTWGKAIKMWEVACDLVFAMEKMRKENPMITLIKGINKMTEIFDMREGRYYPVPADRMGTPSMMIGYVAEEEEEEEEEDEEGDWDEGECAFCYNKIIRRNTHISHYEDKICEDCRSIHGCCCCLEE